ncbi:hypothetical protein M9458_052062, partial [Cirrhinus mrigala]
MAPAVCTAFRLSIALWLILVVTSICRNLSALLVYDRQALFNIRISHEIFINQNIRGDECKDPPFLSAIPDYLREDAPESKESVVVFWFVLEPTFVLRVDLVGDVVVLWPACCRRHFWALRSQGGGGSILSRLRLASLDGLPPPASRKSPCVFSADLLLRFALINVRSVANKTFILNDFFASRELDFMFMTETWLN